MAEKFRRKIEGELAAGVYETDEHKTWGAFKEEFGRRIADGMGSETRAETLRAIAHFERIAKPKLIGVVKTQTIDDYIATRRTERGMRKGSTVSPATVNKELRHLKAVLRIAHEWGYLPKLPKVRMLKEPQKLPRYVTPEHFAAIYAACDVAVRPADHPYEPAAWWRALLTFAYMTGWRISEPLALRWDDVSLDKAEATMWHEDNKARRGERVPLHSVVVDHLRTIVDFGTMVFPWPHHDRTLYSDFLRIQQAAGIDLPCREKHEHTAHCHVYGFHDLRRAFATMNAPTLTADALQALMRHKSYLTTQKYINMSRQLDRAVETLHVPPVLRKAN